MGQGEGEGEGEGEGRGKSQRERSPFCYLCARARLLTLPAPLVQHRADACCGGGRVFSPGDRHRPELARHFEPGGCAAFRSFFNTSVLTHPAQRKAVLDPGGCAAFRSHSNANKRADTSPVGSVVCETIMERQVHFQSCD